MSTPEYTDSDWRFYRDEDGEKIEHDDEILKRIYHEPSDTDIQCVGCGTRLPWNISVPWCAPCIALGPPK